VKLDFENYRGNGGGSKDLEELYAHFDWASVESVQDMKRITPNLKKIWY
jgi:hypothetical protein